jgi:cytochrome c553
MIKEGEKSNHDIITRIPAKKHKLVKRIALILSSIAPTIIVVTTVFAQVIQSQPATTQAVKSAPTPPPLVSEIPRAHQKLSRPDISLAALQEAESTFINKCSCCHGEKGYGDGP